MIVTHRFDFPKRGQIIFVDRLPDRIRLGDHLTRGDLHWKIVGVDNLRVAGQEARRYGLIVPHTPVVEVGWRLGLDPRT